VEALVEKRRLAEPYWSCYRSDSDKNIVNTVVAGKKTGLDGVPTRGLSFAFLCILFRALFGKKSLGMEQLRISPMPEERPTAPE
jgi:hypothetical protein